MWAVFLGTRGSGDNLNMVDYLSESFVRSKMIMFFEGKPTNDKKRLILLKNFLSVIRAILWGSLCLFSSETLLGKKKKKETLREE